MVLGNDFTTDKTIRSCKSPEQVTCVSQCCGTFSVIHYRARIIVTIVRTFGLECVIYALYGMAKTSEVTTKVV